MSNIREYLQSHRHQELFLEELGWDRASGNLAVTWKRHTFQFEAIAQKRGFVVLRGTTNNLSLVNRTLLRRVQRQVVQHFHEHILIFVCPLPPKQVWQWAIRRPDGHRLHHREHPFFSDRPPERFIERLVGLQFSLAEEEGVTLLDALSRVRDVLDTKSELHLFVRRPRFAEESDRLARAMKSGGPTELRAFLDYHVKLVRKIAEQTYRYYRIELDDAEQVCALGLIRAARKFDPDRGCQFSTYAVRWMKSLLGLHAPAIRLPIHFPPYIRPACEDAADAFEQFLCSKGATIGTTFFDGYCNNDDSLRQAAETFLRTIEMRSLSRKGEPEFRELLQRRDPSGTPDDAIVWQETLTEVASLIDTLDDRTAKMMRRYYGFDGPCLTLEAIGDEFKVTRERVRQLLREGRQRMLSAITASDSARGPHAITSAPA